MDLDGRTHLVGASCSSISPLMRVAMSNDAALISSCDLETLNLESNSSSALIDCAFSDLIWPGVWALVSVMPGAMAADGEDVEGSEFEVEESGGILGCGAYDLWVRSRKSC